MCGVRYRSYVIWRTALAETSEIRVFGSSSVAGISAYAPDSRGFFYAQGAVWKLCNLAHRSPEGARIEIWVSPYARLT